MQLNRHLGKNKIILTSFNYFTNESESNFSMIWHKIRRKQRNYHKTLPMKRIITLLFTVFFYRHLLLKNWIMTTILNGF